MSLQRNIPLTNIISCLMWGRFFIPVLALFYIASLVPLEQFAIIMSVFSLTILLLEVPTGVITDIIGRKNALLISRLMYIIEIYILAFHNGFAAFLIAKVISGIGVSFGSGTVEALLFDTLKKLGRQNDYKRVMGFNKMFANVSMAIVFVAGSIMFTVNPKLPAYASLPLVILGFILTLFLSEPNTYSRRMTMKDAFEQLKEGINVVRMDAHIKFMMLYYFAAAGVVVVTQSFSSEYFTEILLPVAAIGAIAFVSSLVSAYGSKIAHAFHEKLKDKSFLMIHFYLLLAISLMSFMLPLVSVLFYMLLSLVYGLTDVLISDFTNNRIETAHRATVLSIQNMFKELGIFALFALTAFFVEVESLRFAIVSMSIIMLALSAIAFMYAGKHKIFSKA